LRPPRPRPAQGQQQAQAQAQAQSPASTQAPAAGPPAANGAGEDEQAAANAEQEQPPAFPGPDGANPRGPNPYGHILEFTETGNDAAALQFSWDVFLLAGDPQREGLAAEIVPGRLASAVAYYAGISDSEGLSPFANPDNLGFDAAGNLWIVTDGSQPNDNNNGCFMCPTGGPDRGRVRQFMSGPVGCEVSGCTFAPDGETLFLTVQHPTGHWPDGGESPPRSSLIAIRSVDPMRRFFV
jgi:secreted PhoX family phosphatase